MIDAIGAEVRRIKKDEELIGKVITVLALSYKNKCLIDKSKFDAVKIYLSYQIDQMRAENRTEAIELEKEFETNNFLIEIGSAYSGVTVQKSLDTLL